MTKNRFWGYVSNKLRKQYKDPEISLLGVGSEMRALVGKWKYAQEAGLLFTRDSELGSRFTRLVDQWVKIDDEDEECRSLKRARRKGGVKNERVPRVVTASRAEPLLVEKEEEPIVVDIRSIPMEVQSSMDTAQSSGDDSRQSVIEQLKEDARQAQESILESVRSLSETVEQQSSELSQLRQEVAELKIVKQEFMAFQSHREDIGNIRGQFVEQGNMLVSVGG